VSFDWDIGRNTVRIGAEKPVTALASAHERRIGQIPLFPALTSARLISDKREVGSSSLPRPTVGRVKHRLVLGDWAGFLLPTLCAVGGRIPIRLWLGVAQLTGAVSIELRGSVLLFLAIRPPIGQPTREQRRIR